VGAGFLTTQARRSQERHLRVRFGRPQPTGWVQFKSEYYLYGIIFLIFDVETIFLLPFAVAFKGLSSGSVRGDVDFHPVAG
jgi:NADH:ubiquinone oxidoreductase subunit 3 (subunit A)